MGLDPATLPDRVKSKIAARPRGKEWRTFEEAEEERVVELERKEHRKFCGWLDRDEYAYCHCRTDKRTTTNLGVPDFLIGCRVGLAIEFKRLGGKLSSEQQRWRERHEARGGVYFIVYSYQEAVAAVEALEALGAS